MDIELEAIAEIQNRVAIDQRLVISPVSSFQFTLGPGVDQQRFGGAVFPQVQAGDVLFVTVQFSVIGRATFGVVETRDRCKPITPHTLNHNSFSDWSAANLSAYFEAVADGDAEFQVQFSRFATQGAPEEKKIDNLILTARNIGRRK